MVNLSKVKLLLSHSCANKGAFIKLLFFDLLNTWLLWNEEETLFSD